MPKRKTPAKKTRAAEPAPKNTKKAKAKVVAAPENKEESPQDKPWTYHPRVIDKEESKRLYDTLSGMVDPVQKKVRLFGKEHNEPRLTRFFSRLAPEHTYTYSGVVQRNHGWPQVLADLADRASALIDGKVVFDSALINYYRDGDDCVGWHNDKDALDGYVVSFSFGTTRAFRIRNNEDNDITALDLEEGSVLVMEQGMQREYQHSLPRRSTRLVPKGRVNVTFRQHRVLLK